MKIRKGLKKDLPTVLKLIKELADYEKARDQVTITLEELENDGFCEKPFYWFLVVEKNKEIIGLSFYWIRYSTWKGKFLFLEDFIVKEKYRRGSIGSKLFAATIQVCYEMNMNGMCWQVLEWNTPAINFYKKHKADISSQWLNGKLTKKQIEKFVKKKTAF